MISEWWNKTVSNVSLVSEKHWRGIFSDFFDINQERNQERKTENWKKNLNGSFADVKTERQTAFSKC